MEDLKNNKRKRFSIAASKDDDKDPEDVDGQERGYVAVNQGTYKAQKQRLSSTTDRIKASKDGNDTYLPAAFQHSKPVVFRSFIPITTAGGQCANQHAVTYDEVKSSCGQQVPSLGLRKTCEWYSSGFNRDKPESRKSSEIVRQLQGPAVHVVPKDWSVLRGPEPKKKCKKPKYYLKDGVPEEMITQFK